MLKEIINTEKNYAKEKEKKYKINTCANNR